MKKIVLVGLITLVILVGGCLGQPKTTSADEMKQNVSELHAIVSGTYCT